MPVVAAMMVPIMATEMPSPPGTRRSSTCRVWRRSVAMPLFSNIVPMKMNMGMVTRIGFSATLPQTRATML